MENKPRYAIVRVSEHFCEAQQICNEGDTLCQCEINKPCRYGDTKEQLIRKVQTAIERLKNDKSRIVVGNDMWAKFIVEFLGVKE